MDISTRQMRAFLALQRHQNFTRAASDVSLSQPAFSSLIRVLEGTVGHQLVERSPGRLVLTAAGERFAKIAESLISRFDSEMAAFSRLLDPVQHVKLAAMVATTYELIPPLLAKLHEQFPQVHVDMLAVFPQDCLNLVSTKRVDIAVTAFDVAPRDVRTEVLWSDPFRLVCRRDHPLAAVEQVALADLILYPFIHYSGNTLARSQIDRVLADKPMNVVFETEHIYTIKALVESGMGIGLATEMNRRLFESETLTMRPIEDGDLVRSVGLAWHCANPPGGACLALVDMLRVAASAM